MIYLYFDFAKTLTLYFLKILLCLKVKLASTRKCNFIGLYLHLLEFIGHLFTRPETPDAIFAKLKY